MLEQAHLLDEYDTAQAARLRKIIETHITAGTYTIPEADEDDEVVVFIDLDLDDHNLVRAFSRAHAIPPKNGPRMRAIALARIPKMEPEGSGSESGPDLAARRFLFKSALEDIARELHTRTLVTDTLQLEHLPVWSAKRRSEDATENSEDLFSDYNTEEIEEFIGAMVDEGVAMRYVPWFCNPELRV